MIFIVSSGKWIFVFSENKILFLRRKNERWPFCSRNDGLSKTIALEYDLSYIMRKDGISFC